MVHGEGEGEGDDEGEDGNWERKMKSGLFGMTSGEGGKQARPFQGKEGKESTERVRTPFCLAQTKPF